MRAGIGYDVHPLRPGLRLVLGGVRIDHECGLAGHSDADAVTHAIMDALLGAACLPDIGVYFPVDDPRYEGADSMELLRQVCALVAQAGFRPENVDCTIIAERPKLAPHMPEMRRRVAAALGLGETCVGVKATTNEGLGFIGRGEGIAALAVATVTELQGKS